MSIKAIINGASSFYGIRKGSTSLNGKSFTPIYTEMTKYPMVIHAVNFMANDKVTHLWRIVIDGEKAFPFTDEGTIHPNKLMNIMPVKVASGCYLSIEVKSKINDDKDVIIMDELDIEEMR